MTGPSRETNPYLPRPAQITEVIEENRNVKTYALKALDNSEGGITFKPGNFTILSLLGVGEAAFSVSSDPARTDGFENTVRRVGLVTSALFRLKPGDKVGFRGPYGNSWPLEKAVGMDLLIIGGGIGLAPLRPVIKHVAKHRGLYGRIYLLYGARTIGDMIFTREFSSWHKTPGMTLLLTVDEAPTSTEWNGSVGVVTNLLDDVKVDPATTLAFVCGPEVMMKFSVEKLTRMGFPPGSIYVSLERRMKCGVAKCGHCQIGPKYVCRDGPVFSLAEIGLLPDVIE
ncbi:MAG: FAD/NAD(P)-binding protein [Candidatus Bathyarchaeia archaeon]